MNIISHSELAPVRLRDFLPADEVCAVDEWEFMDDLWVGEIAGFTQFMRLDEEPDALRSVSLHLAALPAPVIDSMLSRFRLPLRPGMRIEEIVAALGQPTGEDRFVPDRRSFEFSVGQPDPYVISCTVLDDGGLTYIVMITPTPRRLSE